MPAGKCGKEEVDHCGGHSENVDDVVPECHDLHDGLVGHWRSEVECLDFVGDIQQLKKELGERVLFLLELKVGLAVDFELSPRQELLELLQVHVNADHFLVEGQIFRVLSEIDDHSFAIVLDNEPQTEVLLQQLKRMVKILGVVVAQVLRVGRQLDVQFRRTEVGPEQGVVHKNIAQ